MYLLLSATDQTHHQLISMLDTLLAKMDAETKKKKLQEEHNGILKDKIATTIDNIRNLMHTQNGLPKKR